MLVERKLVVVPTLPLTKVAVATRLVVLLRLTFTEVVLEARLVVVFVLALIRSVIAARLVVVLTLTSLALVVDCTVTELIEVSVWPRGKIFPSTIFCKIWVLIVAATTTPFPSMVWVTGLPAKPKIVSHPREGTGPKLVAKRLAKNVNRLFDAPGAGEPAPVNNFWFKAMKSPDSAYLVQ